MTKRSLPTGDGTDNLIEIRPGVQAPEGQPDADQSPLELKGSKLDRCEHVSCWVNVEDRTVTCKRCGTPQDAFDRLYDIATRWENYAGWVRHAQTERKRLEKSVKELKAAEKLVKARLRRAIARAQREGAP